MVYPTSVSSLVPGGPAGVGVGSQLVMLRDTTDCVFLVMFLQVFGQTGNVFILSFLYPYQRLGM